jgi:hypothetical protein
VPYLLAKDARSAFAIAEREASRPDLGIELKAIWETILFIEDPSKYRTRWSAFVSSGDFNWHVLELLQGNELIGTKSPTLTPKHLSIAIKVIGSRFANRSPPTGTWRGRQHTWEATSFVAKQIENLALLEDQDGERILVEFLSDSLLASYHDLIRHRLAQRANRRRNSTFVFASPTDIARAIQNNAPATATDLLAYVSLHLNVLNRELKHTQMEVYRGYWNHDGSKLLEPKYEEVCSGLLASDLQTRIRPHGLVVTVEHHMVANKECDIVVTQAPGRLLPIEAKHHYHADLWTAWREQLDRLYTRDAAADGLGIYLVFWSGETPSRRMPKLPDGVTVRPSTATELRSTLESQIPENDKGRIQVVVIDIAPVA